MKKFIFTVFMSINFANFAFSHTILGDASTLTRGTLPNARLDATSVTLQGNLITISTVASGLNLKVSEISIATSALQTTINNTISKRYAKIIIGTTSVNGADVFGTTTEVFDFAVSTLGGLVPGTSGTIFVQAGDYIYSGKGSTIPAGVKVIFDKGAWIRWDDTKRYNTIFNTSGTIDGINLDITTGIAVAGGTGLINMLGGGIVRNAEVILRLDRVATSALTPLIVNFGRFSNNASVENMFISSFSIESNGGSPQSTALVVVNGSTGKIGRAHV